MKRVIISSNISHYYHSALALKKKGILQKYITGFYLKQDSILIKLLPEKILNKVSDRIDHSLGSLYIKSFVSLDLIYKILLRNNVGNRKKIILLYNKIFDFFASKQIQECDVFHFVSSIGYKSALKAKKLGAKIVVDERAEHPVFLEEILREELNNRFNYVKYKDAYRVFWKESVLKEYVLADYFIVASNFVKRTFIEQGVDSKKIFVVPYGCDLSRFYPVPKKDNKFRILYVGQITPRKGVHYLLEAFKKMDNKESELVLIGKIDDVMKDLVNEYLMENKNIKHYSYVPNNQLRDYYTNSSVFVLPSLSDAFGLVVLEAMACGLPVIVTENVGAADIIEDGIDGFIIPIRNSDAIMEKLQILYKDQSLLKNMGEKAIIKSRKYNWDSYEESLIKVYNHIFSVKE